MANFAEIDENNKVTNIIVAETINDKPVGKIWVEDNGTKGRPAVIGGNYDPNLNVFIDFQPYPSWTLDSNKEWQPPVAKPTVTYTFNEELRDAEGVPTGEFVTKETIWFVNWNEDNLRWEGRQHLIAPTVLYYWNPDNSTWILI